MAKHLRYTRRTSRRLARALFHAMARYQAKLDKQQVLLGRFVDIGTELFAMTATCARAQSLLKSGSKEEREETLRLVNYFCLEARLRIKSKFSGVRDNADAQGYKVARQVLEGDYPHLKDGIVD